MNVKKTYKELIKEFLNKGGSPSFIDKLSPIYSLQNEAKLRFELRKLAPKKAIVKNSASSPSTLVDNAESNAKITLNDVGFISEYPVELHPLYIERKQKFIAACSLKIRLNTILDNDVKEAYKLQQLIEKCFDVIDKANYILNHYREYKRILPLETKADFSKLKKTELVQRRNTIRSNISNRSKTIEKLREQVSEATPKNKLRLQSKLTQKLEQLEELKLQIDELDKLIQ